MKKYLKLLLTTVSFTFLANKVISTDLYIDQYTINSQLSQLLEDGASLYGFQGKTLVETPKYKGFSNLYPEGQYPKIPRIHSYNHNPEYTYLSLEIPSIIKNQVSNDVLNQIFPNINRENINVFFLAQNIDFGQEQITLRPHYYIDDAIEKNDFSYSSNKNISAAIFNLDSKSNLILENLPEGNFYKNNISTHPGQDPYGNPSLVASGSDFRITGYNREVGALFCSLVLYNDENISQSKGALTFHLIPPLERGEMVNQDFQDLITNGNVRKLYDKIFSEIDTNTFEKALEKMLSKMNLKEVFVEDYTSLYYKNHLLPEIQKYFSENGLSLGPLWYDFNALEISDFAKSMKEDFYHPETLLKNAGFDLRILDNLPVWNPLDDYVGRYYKQHLLPGIQKHFSENGLSLGPLWYDFNALEISDFATNMGKGFYNPETLLKNAGFDLRILDNLPVWNPLDDYVGRYYKQHLLPGIQNHFSENGLSLGPLWYNYEALKVSEFATNMGRDFYNPETLLKNAGFDLKILDNLPVLKTTM
ncbi:MAG: hypothetical protein ACRYGR_03870 [Janthinobacterium lividum]